MSNPKPKGFQPGASGNPKGRPVGTTSKIKNSKLRKTLNKLREIEDKALENIEKSVNGQEVDKEVLSNSRWVITTIVTVQKACVNEEEFKKSLEDDEDNSPSFEKPSSKFNLNIVS